jgi:hypothetical protein
VFVAYKVADPDNGSRLTAGKNVPTLASVVEPPNDVTLA